MPSSVVEIYQHPRGTCCFHLHSSTLKDGGSISTTHQQISTYCEHPTRQCSSSSHYVLSGLSHTFSNHGQFLATVQFMQHQKLHSSVFIQLIQHVKNRKSVYEIMCHCTIISCMPILEMEGYHHILM